jgi:DNA-binding response OmpR family regulator
MNVLLVTRSPSRADSEADSPARALADLGCRVTAVGFDLDLDESGEAPAAIVIDGRDRLESAYACLKQLRARPELAATPSLLVVSVGRLPGLDFGAADDFLLHPVLPAELYARLRQLDWRLAAFAGEERLKVGDLLLDLAGYEAFLRDRKLELTHQEFELLKFLAQHRGKVFTRAQLLAKVWGYRSGFDGGTRTVDIHVRRLRAKLGSGADRLIETVRNVGYKMLGG